MLDNYDLWEKHEREKEKRINQRPICNECCEHIQGEFAWQINGVWICEDCLKSYRVNIDDWLYDL